MISDILHNACLDIERWQETYPEVYDGLRDHIEVVKKVMESLQERLDDPPFAIGIWYGPLLFDSLSEKQRCSWRVWCEAGIARWAERLRLLEVFPPTELAATLGNAMQRQDAMLNESNGDEPRGKRRHFLTCLFVWCFLDEIEPLRERLGRLLPALESDNETMPADACRWLSLPDGSTYAEGVRAVRVRL